MAVPPAVVTGTPITAAWGNQVAQALVNPFSSSGARSSGITSPTAGQTTAQTTNDSGEGLEVYTSAGTWRKPWSLPWGVQTYSSTTTPSSTTSGTTELVIATSGSVTVVGNRLYRITCSGTTLGTVASDLFNMQIRLTNTSGTSYFDQKHTVTGASFQTDFGIVCYASGVTTGSQVFVLTVQRQAGTGTLQTLSGAKLHWIVEDAGPTGAPA